MKKLVLAVIIVVLAIPFAVAAQNPPADGPNRLKDYMRTIKFDGLNLSVVYMNDKTVDVLFQAPTKYAMRARTHQATLLYVQGTPQKDFDFDNTVTIEQNGKTLHGTSTNIKNFETKKIAKGERIDGIVEFTEKVDLTKAFKVKTGKESVEFKFTEEQLKN